MKTPVFYVDCSVCWSPPQASGCTVLPSGPSWLSPCSSTGIVPADTQQPHLTDKYSNSFLVRTFQLPFILKPQLCEHTDTLHSTSTQVLYGFFLLPVGRWTILTALSVVLTCWPPAPLALLVSILRSFWLIVKDI